MAMLARLVAVASLVGLALHLQGCGSYANLKFPLSSVASLNPDLSMFVEHLGKTGFADSLAGEEPFTVFAPTNEAFKKMSSTLTWLQKNTTALEYVLKYHVVKGVKSINDFNSFEEIKTLDGLNISVRKEGPSVKLNDDAFVTTPDKMAANGVLHVINSVLWPRDLKKPTVQMLAETMPELATLVTALKNTNVSKRLNEAGPWTLFAPTGKAFKSIEKLATKLLNPKNIDKLTEVMKYHVVNDKILLSNLHDGYHRTVPTLDGRQTVEITIEGFATKVNIASVTQPDVLADNGVIQVIDTVLVPDGFVPPADDKVERIHV